MSVGGLGVLGLDYRPSLAQALEKIAPTARPIATLGWEIPPSNGAGFLTRIRQEGDWVLLTTPVSNGAAKRNPWDLLIVNGELPGSAKLTYMPEEKGHELRAELPLADGVDATAQLRRALAGFKKARASLRTHEKRGAPGVKGLDGADHPQAKRLAGLCEEVQWPVHERANGKLAVDLETGTGFHQALLEPSMHGSVCASVEIAECKDYSEESRQAIGTLLLSACGLMRFARASVASDGQPKARFEVRFDTEPHVAELGHALSALSVACRQFGREVAALEDTNLARKYLALRKRSWI